MDAKKRRPNFSKIELNALQTEVSSRHEVVFAKRNEPEVNRRKKRAWNAIAERVSSYGVLRSGEECRKKYIHWSSSVKNKAAEIQRSSRGTGGGPPPTSLNECEQQILSAIPGELIEGINNGIEGGFHNDFNDSDCEESNSERSIEVLHTASSTPTITSQSRVSAKSVQAQALKNQEELLTINRMALRELQQLNANIR